MSAPTIYYYGGNHICHELKPQEDGVWKSDDNFSARKGYRQIIISNPANKDIGGGIPTDLGNYSDVFVRGDTNEVILFDQASEKDSAGHDIGHYKNLLCRTEPSASAGDSEEHNSVTGNGDQGIRILVDLKNVIVPEETSLTELDTGRPHVLARYMVRPSKTAKYEIGFIMDGKKYAAPLNDGKPDDDIIILIKFRDGKPVKLKLQGEEWPAADNVLPLLPPKTPFQKADDILHSPSLARLVKKVESFGEEGKNGVKKLRDKIAAIISSSGTPNIDTIEIMLIKWIAKFEKAYGPAITTETLLNDKEIAPLVAKLNAMGDAGKSRVESLKRAIDITIADSRKPDIGKIKAILEKYIKTLTLVPAPAVAAPVQPVAPQPSASTPTVPAAAAAAADENPYPTIASMPSAQPVPAPSALAPVAAAPASAVAAPAPAAAPAAQPVVAPPAVVPPPKEKSQFEAFILRYHQFTMATDGYHKKVVSEGDPLNGITTAYGKLYPYLDEKSKTYIKDDNEYMMAKNYLAAATLEFVFVHMRESKPTNTTPQKLSDGVASALNGLKAAPDGIYKEPIERLESLALKLDGFIDKLEAAKKRLEDEKAIGPESSVKLSHYKKFSDIIKDASYPKFPAGVRVMGEFDLPTGRGENDHNPIYYMVVAKDLDLEAAFGPLQAVFPSSKWIYCFANADDTIIIDRYHAKTPEISALGDPMENGDRYIFWVTRDAADRIEKAPGVQDVTAHKEIPLKEALKSRIAQEAEKISKEMEKLELLMPDK
jgi:hypothetical protein